MKLRTRYAIAGIAALAALADVLWLREMEFRAEKFLPISSVCRQTCVPQLQLPLWC